MSAAKSADASAVSLSADPDSRKGKNNVASGANTSLDADSVATSGVRESYGGRRLSTADALSSTAADSSCGGGGEKPVTESRMRIRQLLEKQKADDEDRVKRDKEREERMKDVFTKESHKKMLWIFH